MTKLASMCAVVASWLTVVVTQLVLMLVFEPLMTGMTLSEAYSEYPEGGEPLFWTVLVWLAVTGLIVVGIAQGIHSAKVRWRGDAPNSWRRVMWGTTFIVGMTLSASVVPAILALSGWQRVVPGDLRSGDIYNPIFVITLIGPALLVVALVWWIAGLIQWGLAARAEFEQSLT